VHVARLLFDILCCSLAQIDLDASVRQALYLGRVVGPINGPVRGSPARRLLLLAQRAMEQYRGLTPPASANPEMCSFYKKTI